MKTRNFDMTKLETRYMLFVVEDMEAFYTFVHDTVGVFSFKRLLNSSYHMPMRDAKEKLDKLYERVRIVLGMDEPFYNLSKGGKVTVELYYGVKALEKRYHDFQGKVPLMSRAFYSNHYRTICINVGDVTRGILVHELTHFLIRTCPASFPRTCTEVLAMHADKNLYRPVKKRKGGL